MYSVKTTVLELKFMIQHEPKGFSAVLMSQLENKTITRQLRNNIDGKVQRAGMIAKYNESEAPRQPPRIVNSIASG